MSTNVPFGHLYKRETKEEYLVRISQKDKVESSDTIGVEVEKLVIEAE